MSQQPKSLYVSSLESPDKEWDISNFDWVNFKHPFPNLRSRQIHFAFASEKSFDKQFFDLIRKHSEKLKLLLLYCREKDLDPCLHQLIENVSKETIRKTIAFYDFKVVNRIINAWKNGAQEVLISNAFVLESKLIVVDCASNRYSLPYEKLPELELPRTNKKIFEIDPDGSFLFWPEADFHINLEEMRSRIDPKFSAAMIRKQIPKNALYGSAIRRFREISKIKQVDITGISERTIRRIESGEFIPTVETLKKISSTHELDLSSYLNEVAAIYQSIKHSDSANK
jgi:uncharacterized protein YlbG (UPF0298 family)/DNA-binding XRE family transcriptional regulator